MYIGQTGKVKSKFDRPTKGTVRGYIVRIFLFDGEKVMVVSIQTEPTLEAEAPRLLFVYPEGSSRGVFEGYLPLSYNIAPDDQRFLFIQQGWPTQINVVLNWFEELKRLAPTGN